MRCDRSIKSSNHYISIWASNPLLQPITVENTSRLTRRVLPSFKQLAPSSTILYAQGAAEEPPTLITKTHSMECENKIYFYQGNTMRFFTIKLHLI